MPAHTPAPLRERAISFLQSPDSGDGDASHWSLVDLEGECQRLTTCIGRRMGFESRELEDLGRDFYVHLTEQGQRRLRSLPQQGKNIAWLARSCTNFLVDAYRLRLRRLREVPFTEDVLAIPDEENCVETVVLERLDRETCRRRVTTALRAISHPERNLLALHYLAGLTHTQIAERLGCSAATVRQRCSRAVRRVRARLEP
jgi:RNA polymerase sigma factor (sigma-70 family)